MQTASCAQGDVPFVASVRPAHTRRMCHEWRGNGCLFLARWLTRVQPLAVALLSVGPLHGLGEQGIVCPLTIAAEGERLSSPDCMGPGQQGGGVRSAGRHTMRVSHIPPLFLAAGLLRHLSHGVFATWLYMVTHISTEIAKFPPR